MATAWAISSDCSSLAGSLPVWGLNSVSTVPGQTALTRIPYWRRSSAIHPVRPIRPHLEAQYTPPFLKVFFPASEAILMMWPVLRSIMPGATALLIRNTDFKLVSNTVSQLSSLASCAGPNQPTPALFTRMSMGPRFLITTCTKEEIGAAWVMSNGTSNTAGARPRSSAVADESLWESREQTPNLAPIFPRPRAMASPMPRLAPVTTAIFPSSGFEEDMFVAPGNSWKQTGRQISGIGHHIIM